MLVEKFVNIFPTDQNLKKIYIDEVWEMLNASYAKIGGPLKAKNALLKNNCFWKLIKRGHKISAAVIYKIDDSYGRKCMLCGCDQSEQGKQDLFKILIDDMNLSDRNAWGEFSGAIEHILLKKGYTPLPNYVAEKILKYLDKDVESINNDGFHYTRIIGGEPHEKAMFGNPPKSITECYNRYFNK